MLGFGVADDWGAAARRFISRLIGAVTQRAWPVTKPMRLCVTGSDNPCRRGCDGFGTGQLLQLGDRRSPACGGRRIAAGGLAWTTN